MFEPAWITEVLHFWFVELGEEHWFAKRPDIDANIRDRFLPLAERLFAEGGSVSSGQRPLLAAVIVLDQFSRNLFRGTPRAFAADSIARRLSKTAIMQGMDVNMTRHERLFLYLPFEHSEDREDQALAIDLIARLGSEEWTRDALAHKEIIDRFGRFPHRNAILGRHSSADELALLEERKQWF
ncbi:MAG TPA: DUF924 family protein [Steroidobacteraceae bacterium]|jgi:uncharacterized protein (DUF924 family)